MLEFNKDAFEIYIRSKIVKAVMYNGEDITDKLIYALLQFAKPPSKLLVDTINRQTLSIKYTVMFGRLSKPISVSLNTWFLHTYKFKYCTKCCVVKSIKDFCVNKAYWDNIHGYCKACHNENTHSWRTNNIEHISTYNKEYRLKNLDKCTAKGAKRRAKKLNATPNWLTLEHYNEIEAFYKKSKELTIATDIKHHVDHIIPLQGKHVSGLHVPWNLQVIMAEQNLRKSNNYDGT